MTSSVNPSVFGQSVTFTATISAVAPGAGTPTGSRHASSMAAAPSERARCSGGTATFTTSMIAVASHTTSSYYGDGNFNGSTGSLTGNPQVVNKATTSTLLSSMPTSPHFADPVTFTATIKAVAPGAGTPTGIVTFFDGGSSIGTGTLSGGVATFTISALAVASHTITTSYAGDGSFYSSTGGPLTEVVSKRPTVLTLNTGGYSFVVFDCTNDVLAAKLTDQEAGTPITGASVTFTIAASGGSPSQIATETTDSSGIASVTLPLTLPVGSATLQPPTSGAATQAAVSVTSPETILANPNVAPGDLQNGKPVTLSCPSSGRAASL